MVRLLMILALAGSTWITPAAAAAQDGSDSAQRVRFPHRPGAERAALERQFRETLGRIVQRELGLTDAQSQRLQRVNQQFDVQRRPLVQRERQTRQELRAQLERGERADEARVSVLLDQLLRVHRDRLDLLEREQRALAEFLTPVQRARYFALQESVRRRVEAQRGRERMGGRPPGRP